MAEVDKSEKITINIGLVDLGQIDLLVDEGFFANRTDFIRTAIRRQLETRSGAVDRDRRAANAHPRHPALQRQELEELRAAGRTVELRVLGLATIAETSRPSSRWRRSHRSRCSGPSARRGQSSQRWHLERCEQRRHGPSTGDPASAP